MTVFVGFFEGIILMVQMVFQHHSPLHLEEGKTNTASIQIQQVTSTACTASVTNTAGVTSTASTAITTSASEVYVSKGVYRKSVLGILSFFFW